jgi:excisionase family DNA binding protein
LVCTPSYGRLSQTGKLRLFDQLTLAGTFPGMVAMTPQKIDGGEYLTVAEAVELMGCSEAWVRTLLGRGKLPGARRIGQRVWLIPHSAATEARDALTTRSLGKQHLAKRPASSRKKAKRKK